MPEIPFDPATEPDPPVVYPPGQAPPPEVVDHPDAGTGHLEDRLARVTGAMSRIPKRGWNKDQKYHFVAQPDILDAVRPALAAERVRFRSELRSMHAEADGRKTGGGMEWCMWRAEMEFTFSCIVGDLREEDTIRWTGWAYDFGDKGGPKAETSALKTFLIQTFLISTGEDPDEAPSEQQQAARPQQDAAASDLRAARHAALDWNQKLPTGKLSAIAKKIADQGAIMKIEDMGQLALIAKAAARYEANPEGGEAWLRGEEPPSAANGEPQPEVEATPKAEAEAESTPEEAEREGGTEPGTEPASSVPPLPPADSYDPPLTEDEQRQHALGVEPRPEGEEGL